MNVSPTDLRFSGVGVSGQTITAYPVDRFGKPSSVEVTWESANLAVATVTRTSSTSASVTAVGAGTTTITAKTAGVSASATVTVSCTVTLGTPAPASIPILLPGQSQRITVPVNAAPGCSSALTWTTSAQTIATVDATGNVTGVTTGNATISARSVQDQSQFVSVPVTVLGINRVSLPAADTIVVGTPKTLTATTDPAGVAVQWSSSNTSIATVGATTGVVTGLADGTVQITAAAVADPTKSASLNLRVRGRVTAVSVNPTAATINVADAVQLTATVNGDPGIDRSVGWTSNDAGIATVSTTGLVTGVGQGQTTVCARAVADATKSACATLDVRGRVIAVSIAPPTNTLSVGATTQLTATVTADPGVSQAVTWSTNSPGVATVSATGVVTGVSDGVATITATSVADNGKSAQASVTVQNIRVAITPRTASVDVGATTTLSASVTAAPGTTIDSLRWSSGSPGVATVNAAGTVTGVAVGTAYIRALAFTRAFAGPAAIDSALVTVSPCTPTGISVTPSNLVMLPGDNQALQVTAIGCQGVPSVTASSSSTIVATVSASLVVTAVARGSATITLRSTANANLQATVNVQVRGVISVVASPAADSIRVGWGRQLTASVSADPGVSTAVSWSSSNPGIATVSGVGVVTGVSQGIVTITARSTVDASKFGTSTIRVGDACSVPVPIIPGQTASGTVNASSCGGDTEYWGWRTGPAAYQITDNAPFNHQFAPLLSSFGYWYWGGPNGYAGSNPQYVIATTGTYRSLVRGVVGGTGTATLSISSWDHTVGCGGFLMTTQLIVPGLALNATCGTGYQPSGTVGTFYARSALVLPAISSGQTISVKVDGVGFEPRIDILDGATVLASGAAAPSQFSFTVSYTSGSTSAIFPIIWLSTRAPLQTGTFTLTVTGPSPGLMVKDANAFVSGAAVPAMGAPAGSSAGCSSGSCAVSAPRTSSGRKPSAQIRAVPPGRSP